MQKHLLSVAPMLDCTDRHFRFLLRLISRQVLLYTEMLTTNEILAPNGNQHLELNSVESPIAIQLGGSEPGDLVQCARRAEQAGFNEVNLNVGCPSSRVQRGGIGACLMRQPELVADCVDAMANAVAVPVTVKCRLGVDDDDSYEQLLHFVSTVAAAGCSRFIIHARKAWLQGLSPKQNRTVPPLQYDKVYRIKQDLPDLEIIINGGISDLIQANQHLQIVDGVMIGRSVYNNPMLLAEVDNLYYAQERQPISVEEVVLRYIDYVEQQLAKGARLTIMTRHLLNIFQGRPRSKLWRRYLSCNSNKQHEGSSIIYAALEEMRV